MNHSAKLLPQNISFKIVLFCLLIWQCTKFETQTPPTTPFLLSPQNNVINVPLDGQLIWQASEDANGDEISYQVFLNDEIVSDGQVAVNFLYAGLSPETLYSWRIVALAGEDSISSDIFRFTTISLMDTGSPVVPTAPILQSPKNGLSEVRLEGTLQWETSTIDGNDTIVYDVYVDNQKVASDLSNTSYAYTGLALNTSYSWYVVAKASNGEETQSATFLFTTIPTLVFAEYDSLYTPISYPEITFTYGPAKFNPDIDTSMNRERVSIIYYEDLLPLEVMVLTDNRLLHNFRYNDFAHGYIQTGNTIDTLAFNRFETDIDPTVLNTITVKVALDENILDNGIVPGPTSEGALQSSKGTIDFTGKNPIPASVLLSSEDINKLIAEEGNIVINQKTVNITGSDDVNTIAIKISGVAGIADLATTVSGNTITIEAAEDLSIRLRE